MCAASILDIPTDKRNAKLLVTDNSIRSLCVFVIMKLSRHGKFFQAAFDSRTFLCYLVSADKLTDTELKVEPFIVSQL